MPDIFDVLKEEHAEVKEIMEEIEEGEAGSRKKLFETLKAKLLLHAKAEQDAFYHRLEEYDETRPIVLEGTKEHEVVERLCKELENVDPKEERWLPEFKVLKESIEHHVKEEEGEMFDLAKKVVDTEDRQELAEAFLERKKELGG